MSMRKPTTVAAYVAQVDEDLRPLFKAVRTFVRKAAPGLTERLYMAMPCYWGDRPLVYIADHTAHVNLGFYEGAHLADPDGVLEGTGKALRHAKVRTKADLTPALARVVKAAATRDKAE